ncbi:MAG: TIGR04283 family arsenosugar biosynthesis glycosyltransferase [SAR324 cluster bacterium]|nr:TIGR04283 family arsenosugar biosynthesis glycosyltransferase [SAR324 cluster bacterium]MCZ6843355.1 TIGR04283 family arsenosugar biosynthesis glycosyltransferase [SAR324 cluster bacterium]
MKLSIIVPVLDEAPLVADALRRLRGIAGDAEILVVDGGSSDGTARLAGACGRVLQSERGRARQLNLGAQEARGEWLLFLHVDTRLPPEFRQAIAEAESTGCAAGVFRLRIVGRHPLLPLLGLGANLRTRLRRIFLGDQALFIRKALFRELGGFPDLPLLEDYAFSLLLKRRGLPCYLSPLRVETSGRRWDTRGFFSTWWLFRRIFHRYRMSGGSAQALGQYEQIR